MLKAWLYFVISDCFIAKFYIVLPANCFIPTLETTHFSFAEIQNGKISRIFWTKKAFKNFAECKMRIHLQYYNIPSKANPCNKLVLITLGGDFSRKSNVINFRLKIQKNCLRNTNNNSAMKDQ